VLRACAAQTTWISTTNIHGRSPALTVAMTNLSGFLDHGGSVRYGTDLGNGPLPLGVNGQETLALQTVGMSVDDVLASMTGPMLGALDTVDTARAADAGRFVAGVAPSVLLNPIDADTRVIGPALRGAEVLSIEEIDHLEKWQG